MTELSVSELYTRAKELATSQEQVAVHGWVRVHRSGEAGKLQFVSICDGSTIKELQLVFHGELEKIDYMASVRATGVLIASPSAGQDWELKAVSIEVVGKCPPDEYPLPRKKLPLTLLRQHPHLRMRTKTMQAVFRVRHAIMMSIYKFFDSRGYICIHTPLITKSDCEGAGEAFSVDGGKKFFPEQAYLTVSGQLQGEMAATAFGKIFTFGPTFRAEHSDTPRHLSEFWMIEPEMAWHDLDDTISVAQDLISTCVRDALRECSDELTVLRDKDHQLQDLDCKRITYTEAVEIIKKHSSKFDIVPEWGDDLGTPHEKFLTDEYFKQPVTVTHYPRTLKSFYMHQDSDGKTVACFDLLLPTIGEVIGGSQREVRYDLLQKEMEVRGLDQSSYQQYLDLRRFGSVPHSGFGLGFERIVRYITGMENIRDVIPFPVYFGHLSC